MGFQVVPVIDLTRGMAVHAVGGHRDQYRPLRSVWQGSAQPVALAATLRQGLGIDRLYVADLDAIEGRPPDRDLHRRLGRAGLHLWLDAGVQDAQRLEPLLDLASDRLEFVLGLESVGGPVPLREIIDRAGPNRVIFSLDLDDGTPRVAPRAAWPGLDPLEIASRVIDLGVRQLILLDLRRVGTDRGIGTDALLEAIRARHDEVAIIVGGGIRGIEDVITLRDRGASAVLVGSAIHDGRIGRRELERIERPSGAIT
jgi:phosphoribosylformimino-5-aminoimidazole carboxamide ribotide isomerase